MKYVIKFEKFSDWFRPKIFGIYYWYDFEISKLEELGFKMNHNITFYYHPKIVNKINIVELRKYTEAKPGIDDHFYNVKIILSNKKEKERDFKTFEEMLKFLKKNPLYYPSEVEIDSDKYNL